MVLNRSVRERAKEFLQPGDDLRYLFAATIVQHTFGITPFNCLVAVTDQRVIVLSCSWSSKYTPTSVYMRFPRNIQLGPVENRPGPCIDIGDLVLEIDDEYIPVVLAADAEVSGEFTPPDPLPDL